MKRLLLALFVMTFAVVAFAQITTTKIAPQAVKIDNTPYDSTSNFLGKDVYKYLGQELYLNGKAQSLRKYGYEGFSIDYNKNSLTNKSNVYKCCDSYDSKYDDLVGKYFTVLEVIKHPRSSEDQYLFGSKFYLKLQEKSKKDIVYFEYDSEMEYKFPFIVVGHFSKLKQAKIGVEYIVRGKNWISSEPMTNMLSGNPVTNFEAGAKWKCIDVTIEEKYFMLSLVLENTKGERIPLSVNNSKSTEWVFEASKAETYKLQFGEEKWQSILAGKVKIGMTEEMCELSWGKPKSVNETISVGKKRVQWVYSENYLHFDNGILSTIQ